MVFFVSYLPRIAVLLPIFRDIAVRDTVVEFIDPLLEPLICCLDIYPGSVDGRKEDTNGPVDGDSLFFRKRTRIAIVS